VKYLELIVEPLAKLGEEIDFIFRIVGAGKEPLPQFRNVKVETHPAIPYDPVRFVPQFNIGVMPLADSDWERGKCGAKLLEYMAAGRPAVSSAVGENIRIIEDGITGLLARTEDEWVAALRNLALNPQLRKQMGESARERVRKMYSSETAASLWNKLLVELSEESFASSVTTP
jgi:glycosyltransferase involved in cell wall biosynthesis